MCASVRGFYKICLTSLATAGSGQSRVVLIKFTNGCWPVTKGNGLAKPKKPLLFADVHGVLFINCTRLSLTEISRTPGMA